MSLCIKNVYFTAFLRDIIIEMELRKLSPKTEVLVVIVAIILVAVGASFLIAPETSKQALAQIGQVPSGVVRSVNVFGFPFGGRITFIENCTTPPQNKFIRLGSPIGGSFIYQPPAIYREGAPSRIGQWLLGVAGPPVGCTVGNTPRTGRLITNNGFMLFGSSN